MEYEHHTHEFPPLYDSSSRILILGSFPSVKSREEQFFYGHPQNRFWKILAALTGEDLPATKEEKRRFALRHGIALWDVIEECDIKGSSDSSIRNVIPTDIPMLLKEAPVQQIYANGALAFRLFEKYQKTRCGRKAVGLPSTSPANAAWTLPKLIERWGVIKEYLQ